MGQIGPLRGIAILAVVISHAPVYGMLVLTWWGNRYGSNNPAPDWSWVGSPTWYALELLNQCGRFAVPLFLFANGFFLQFATRGKAANVTPRLVRTWILGLLPPFCIWLAIATGLYVADVLLTRDPAGIELFRIGWLFGDRWYIVMLLELFALAPLIIRLAEIHPVRVLAGWIAIDVGTRIFAQRMYFGVSTPPLVNDIEQAFDWVNLWGFGSFVILGMVVARYYGAIRPRIAAAKWPLTIAAVCLGAVSFAEAIAIILANGDYSDWATARFSTYPYSLVAVLAFLAWDFGRGKLSKVLVLLGTQSYGIYMIHTVVMDYGSKAMYHLLPNLLDEQLLFIPLMIALGIAIPIFLMVLVARSGFGRYNKLLFGSAPPRIGDLIHTQHGAAHTGRAAATSAP